MAGTTGRLNPLYGWNAYDWAQKMRYGSGAFSAMTMSAQTQTTATATVTAIGALAAGSRIGVMFGTGAGAGGYNRKTPTVAGPGPVGFKLSELQPNTVYHCAAYGFAADGSSWVGTNTLLTTPP